MQIKKVNVITNMIVFSCCHRSLMSIITHHSFSPGICHMEHLFFCLYSLN